MKVLFLCGVTEAGKSKTLRYSVSYLNTSSETKYDFINKRNPRKVIILDDNKKIYMALCSPQELEKNETAVKILNKRINAAFKQEVDLLVLPMNIDKYHETRVNECLDEIMRRGLKLVTNIVYLNAKSSTECYAKKIIFHIESRGYVKMGEIERKDGPKIDEYKKRGQIFAQHINNRLYKT